uniref:Uncharacterized protein n=1 Tax=Spironucleus salmonicida TaxID=348837 RepID=V6LXH3_9EUKA|eukprot:EST48948.1 Hypothetical protein SS50377_10792 [Spironucleus salmonicida]
MIANGKPGSAKWCSGRSQMAGRAQVSISVLNGMGELTRVRRGLRQLMFGSPCQCCLSRCVQGAGCAHLAVGGAASPGSLSSGSLVCLPQRCYRP